MGFLKDKSIRKKFRFAARDAAVEEYLGSDEFLDQMRKAVDGSGYCHFGPDISLIRPRFSSPGIYNFQGIFDKHYASALQTAFLKFKEEYPQFNHVRVNKQGSVVLDTRSNTWIRRRTASGLMYGDC